MSLHFYRDIEKLKKQLYLLGGEVEQAVLRSVHAFVERDENLAREVIEGDERIDEFEVEIEEDCHKILALHQPVAQDLRFLIATLKMDTELERIGDCAVNIAERTLYLATHGEVTLDFDFRAMADVACGMLKKSLDALIQLDVGLARSVIAEDDIVDDLNRQVYEKTYKKLQVEPEKADRFIQLLSVARHIERIADHASNISCDVIYVIGGEIIRHQPEGDETTG